jgi:hypothetical protein
MPLCESKIKPKSWGNIEEQFAIFYASKGDDGIMWCPVRSPYYGRHIGVGFLGLFDEILTLGLSCREGSGRGNLR